MFETIAYTVADGVARVELNRPDRMNAISIQMFKDLVAAGEAIKADNSVRVAILSGSNGNFCAGLDMENFTSGMLDDGFAPRTHGITNLYQQVAWVWHELEVPVLAVVEGACLGGGLQIISGADMRYVSPKSKLSIRETYWGLVPDMAGTALWGEFVRGDILRELTYTARIFSGVEAEQYGFVTKLCDDPLAEALAVADAIVNKSPHTIRACKRLLNNKDRLSAEEALLAESIEQDALAGTPNQMEAVMANMEKRAPNFVDVEG
ncbi:MAG: crotonase/enoyl-CoA hydratase family protein [Candidatus Pelagadaptatus aseana]|uniref:crotonase/enoyl-CoA hydratase family protein n=1 Tax=Candidatus Pelagadaptatus aseana TaxID=3120508 RepID=UPI0039B2B1BF